MNTHGECAGAPILLKLWDLFRNAKQELGLNDCHSTTEIHHHAHLELLFVAETLLNYAQWYENKEKTSDEEGITHGKMVNHLFHTRCEIKLKTRKGSQQVYIYIDTEVRNFARLFDAFWPEEVRNVFRKIVRQPTTSDGYGRTNVAVPRIAKSKSIPYYTTHY